MNSDQTTDFANEVGKLRGLMEQVLDEVKATNEGVGAMREELARVPKREEFEELKQDMKVVNVSSIPLANSKRGDTIRGNQERVLPWKREKVNFALLGQKTRVRRES